MPSRLDLQCVKVTSLVCGASATELMICLGVLNLVLRYILTLLCVCLSPKFILWFFLNFSIVYLDLGAIQALVALHR
jgi:hypothetical protein